MNKKSELVELTPYFKDFINYYRKAEVLQNNCVLGDASPNGLVNDALMEQVHIYDVVNRQFADINNMVQDTFYGTKTPKIGQALEKNGKEYMDTLLKFDQKRNVWTRKEYLYAFLVHRITGSAASYVEDHRLDFNQNGDALCLAAGYGMKSIEGSQKCNFKAFVKALSSAVEEQNDKNKKL